MIKEIKYFFFTFVIFLFIFLTGKFYFSDTNKKNSYRALSNIDNKIDKFSKKLCGRFREGHFEGVLNVINRFIEIIKPRYIFLGKKDYQQLYLIKKHIEKRKIKSKVIECKTIREKNGIAFSTRNSTIHELSTYRI